MGILEQAAEDFDKILSGEGEVVTITPPSNHGECFTVTGNYNSFTDADERDGVGLGIVKSTPVFTFHKNQLGDTPLPASKDLTLTRENGDAFMVDNFTFDEITLIYRAILRKE